MGRRLKVDRPQQIVIYLPTSVREAVNAALYSEIEGRVPFGAMTKLSEQLFRKWLKEERGIEL